MPRSMIFRTRDLLVRERTQLHCTARLWAERKPNPRAAVEAVGDGIASIRVSPGMLPRALGVLELLLLAAEQASYSVR